MTSRYLNDRTDIFRKLTAFSTRVLLGLGLSIVLSMVGLVIAWGLFVFSSSSDRIAFMLMNMVGAGVGASVGVSIAWVKLDGQQRGAFVLTLLLCLGGAIAGALLGYQYGANREMDCCAEPRSSPFIYAAFGATIAGNAVMYLINVATYAIHMIRTGRRTVPERL